MYKNIDKQMKMKLFLVLFFSIMIISCASAYIPHKQYTTFDYSFTSNNATQCNLTTGNTPYGTVTLNQIATKNGQTYNISIGGDYFTSIGSYCFNLVCTDSLSTQTGSVCREVTPSGFTNSISFYLLILILSLGLIIFGIFIKDAPITILGSFGLYFLSFYILFYGLVGMKDNIYTWAIGLIVLGLAFYVSAKSSYELIMD